MLRRLHEFPDDNSDYEEVAGDADSEDDPV